MIGNNMDLFQWFIIFLIKRLLVQNEIISNEELEELHKQLLENIRTKKYTHLLKTLLEPDLTDMQLISKFDKGFQFLQCVSEIYSKYA